eukprot:251841-Chlamydomonas_euryale.AAC.1
MQSMSLAKTSMCICTALQQPAVSAGSGLRDESVVWKLVGNWVCWCACVRTHQRFLLGVIGAGMRAVKLRWSIGVGMRAVKLWCSIGAGMRAMKLRCGDAGGGASVRGCGR